MYYRRNCVAYPLFASLVTLSGCSGSEVDDNFPSSFSGGGRPSTSSSGGSPVVGPTAGQPSVGAGTAGAFSVGGQPGGGGSSGGSGGNPYAGQGGDLPCDVAKIVGKSCGTCHGSPPAFGSGFSLTTASEIRAKGAAILLRTAATEKAMPPPPNARLTAEERSVLEKYINAGAPASTCSDAPSPSGGAGGGSPTRPDDDPDVTCYELTARAGATQKYTVPTTPDFYHCFNWAPPWGSKEVQVVSAHPIIDNDAVLHHWLLYNATGSVQDATSSNCSGAHPNAALIAGWAPGGEPTNVPPDVGIGLSGGGFVLEIHYNNTVGAGELDASGVEVCVTEKKRPNEAAVHWLGTQALNKVEAVGECAPSYRAGDITILSSSPHMHIQGRHMKTVINRVGGSKEILIDKPFDFNTQLAYPTPAVIKPGDTLTTTCTFAQPTPFGQGTNQEMCYNFVLAYPAGALSHGLDILRKFDCTGFL